MLFEHDQDAAERYPYMHQYTNYMKKMERPLIGREHEKQLIQAAMLKPELCNVLLLAEAGTGKGNPLYTIVPVADSRGYIQIGDLKVGDYVFDENGQPTMVLGIYPQGLKRRYDVCFVDGSVIPCNDEHIWNARTRWHHYHGHPYESHTLRELLDYGITRTGHRTRRGPQEMKSWYIPRNKAVARPALDLPIHPYAIGVFLGDGCMTDPALAVSSNDEPVVQRVAELIGAIGIEQNKCTCTWHFLSSEGATKFVRMRDFEALLPNSKVFGYESLEKRVPEEYFLGSIEQRMELLRGLMDTDGCVHGSDGRVNVSFATNNKDLALDVQKLAASLGYRTKLGQNERYDDIHKNTEYRVYFMESDQTACDLFWLQRHKDRIVANTRDDKKFKHIYDDLAIAEVIDTGRDEEMVCIYVEAPSHLFQIGESHIVTHNTALVQGIMAEDVERIYLEVDLPKMLTNLRDTNEMADRLKTLFSEVSKFRSEKEKDVVLFIDEFHQIVQLSSAAVEVLKPMLADSGTRGIRFIAATTQIEYQQWIAPNLPLVERLQRIRLVQPGEDVVASILSSMCRRYGVTPASPELFSDIYTYTNRYIPATSQPRKSILILDTMIGWHRLLGRPLDRRLLADVIYETEGINVAFRVDASAIKKRLDAAVLAQEVATSSIEQRMQICVAGLNNPNRPMSSFLFCGSTGVGKTEATKQLAKILYDDDRNLIRFDMTEFALDHSLDRFRRELTNRVSAIPYCLILLDEIEKACPPVTRVLLQVLDDGRLLDENEREVTFKNAYIIVTTNSGAEVFQTISNYGQSDKADSKTLDKYDKLLRESILAQSGSKFPPELLGRIDCIVPFQPLSRRTMMRIVNMKLGTLAATVKHKHGVTLRVHKNLYPYLIFDKLDTDSNSGGARIVVSKLEREVTVPLSRYINEHPMEKEIFVSIGGEMAVMNKRMVESEAYVHVGTKFLNADRDVMKEMGTS